MFKKVEQLGLLLVPVLSITAFSSYNSHILYEFSYLIVPQFLTILFPSLIIPTLLFLLTFIYFFKKLRVEYKHEPRIYFDIARVLTITQTTICILLCDFPFWCKRFSKNHYFDIGLMDIGVGCFVFNAGIISCKIQKKKLLKNTLLMLLLGAVRLFVVETFNLDVNILEYGKHWNFYFTLSFVNITFLLLDSKYNFIVGSSILVIYEFLNKSFVFNYLLFKENRTNFIMQNKEGIFSLIPTTGIYLVLNSIGKYILEKDLNLAIYNVKRLWSCNLIIFICSSIYSECSRRIINLNYNCYILFIELTFILLFMYLGKLYSFNNLYLFKFCSTSILPIFLFSNLLVLIFKQCFDLEKMKLLEGSSLTMFYLSLNFIILPLVMKINK